MHGSYGYDYDHVISPSGTQVMWIPPSLRGIIQHPLLFSTWLIIVQDSTPGSENWKPLDLLIVSPMFVKNARNVQWYMSANTSLRHLNTSWEGTRYLDPPKHNWNTSWKGTWTPQRIPETPSEKVFGCLGIYNICIYIHINNTSTPEVWDKPWKNSGRMTTTWDFWDGKHLGWRY